jgi:hypothetical protein
MRRFAAVFVAGFLALTLGSQIAFAQSAHFVGDFTISKSLSAGLSVSGKAAGLGDGPTNAFLTAASVSARYECVNHGGNVAPGQPVVEQNVTGPVKPITPHNGQITFTVTIPPPSTPSSATECPSGKWTVRLTSLTYTNVVVHVVNADTNLTESLGTIDP